MSFDSVCTEFLEHLDKVGIVTFLTKYIKVILLCIFQEQKFVETRIKKFGIFVVVLRYKKDSLMLLKRGAKVTSTVDSRVSFTCKPGTFKVDTNFNLEVRQYKL